MKSRITRATLLFAALALAGCNGTLEDIAPKAERQLPASIITSMKAKGMSKTSPIMMRIFKEEGELEVWKQKQNGRYALISNYEICKWSGKLGPKFAEGDRQAPEGFYAVRPAQMNPKSSYHLSFNMGFPNAYDRANGRTGQHLMVHGACSSAGCYSMTDEQVEEIYAFARDAFRGGQRDFQIQAFPFRMTADNMARYRSDPNYAFWKMLKEGHDYFELTKTPPKVDVCGKRYVFNVNAAEGASFSPTAACPPMSQPESLQLAYQKYQTQYEKAYAAALGARKLPEPKASITSLEEARLVADWSKRRASGERVSREPPSIAPVAVAETQNTPAAPTASAYTVAQPSAMQQALEAASQPPAPQGEEAPVMTGSIPQPTPNPQEAAAGTSSTPPAAEAASPVSPPAQQKRSRVWNLFGR